MKSLVIGRRAAIALVGAVILLFTLAAVVLRVPADAAPSSAQHATAHDGGHGAPDVPRTDGQVALHDQMRKLWEDHITWTRLAIVAFADGSAGFDATAARLLQNQTDIGDAIKPYYGEAAGNQLTTLLSAHITIAVELLKAAKAGDADALTDAKARWYANSDQIADFLAAANPRWWPQADMRAAMKMHLDQTLTEAVHELTGDYAGSVTDYEQVHLHILGMADLLSFGIWRQFPGTVN
jgi:hypothetical protein